MGQWTKAFLMVVVLLFGGLTALAIQQNGMLGIFEHQFSNWAGLQVLVDLAIALVLVLVWLVKDARALGLNPLPWVVVTLLAGSFGPLLYLILRKSLAQRKRVNN